MRYQKRWMPALSSHWVQVTLIWDARTLDSQIQRLVELTRVIATLLFTYQQVRENGSFHFFARELARSLSVASASPQRRPSTEATKGVKLRRLLNQSCRYFFLLSRSVISKHFLGGLDWYETGKGGRGGGWVS